MPFEADQVYCVLDYETRARINLKLVGAWEYSLAASILCVAWKMGTRAQLKDKANKTRVWSPAIASGYGELIRALCDPSVILVAHNALFEQVITRNTLSRIVHRPELKTLPPDRWICTATLAAALALPRSLEDACRVLGLAVQKDMDGHRLMLKMSKPRKPTKNNPAEWHQSKADLVRLMAYCVRDVDAETELFLRCPPLTDDERRTWILDQVINLRGFHVDRDLVNKALKMTESEVARLNGEVRRITGGAVDSVNKRDALLSWLACNGCRMPDLRASTVRDYLKEGIVNDNEPAKLCLEARQAGAKSSTKKFRAFEIRSRSDGRIRDHLLYHGASTGRFSGRGVQIQNLPRPTIRDTDTAAEVVKTGDLDTIRAIYGNPLDCFSNVLRSVIVPPPGQVFFCGDYAAIEVRVLFWLAGHERGLKSLHAGDDLYKDLAAEIYRRPVTSIVKGSVERQLGKQATLGCGYGMGKDKFRETCRHSYGLEISDDLAERAVKAYRRVHSPVTRLWSNYERAAILATQRPGISVKVARVKWFVRDGFLWCELPSGRKLAYAAPEVHYAKTSWCDKRPHLTYLAQVMKAGEKWVRIPNWGGGLTENIDQAISRDLLVYSMHRVEAAGYEIDIHAHDENLTHKSIDSGASTSEFESIMAGLPPWAEGLPVKVETWTGVRYRK